MVLGSSPVAVNLFCCYEKVVTLMIIWVMGKVQWNNITWKKGFYSNLSLEEITDVDYMYGKKFVKTLKYKIKISWFLF